MPAQIVFTGGPKAAGGSPLGLCLLCTMVAKGVSNANVQDKIDEANAMEDGVMEIESDLKGSQPVQAAVTMGFNPMIQDALERQLGLNPSVGQHVPPIIVPLCWGHNLGLTIQPGGIIQPATVGEMPKSRSGLSIASR